MKRRDIVSLFVCTLFVLSVTGCWGSKENIDVQKIDNQSDVKQVTPLNESSKQNNSVNSQNKNGTEKSDTVLSPNGNDRPNPGQAGQVTKIDGTSISLAIIEKPVRNDTPPPAQSTDPNNPPANVPRKEDGPGSPKLTGTTITILVPTTAKIIYGSRDNPQEKNISSIQVGDMIEVFYKDGTNNGTVESIRVMQVPPENGSK